MMVTEQHVLSVLSADEALTVMEVAERVAWRYPDAPNAWENRTNVRTRLYALEEQGGAICDDGRPQRWMASQ